MRITHSANSLPTMPAVPLHKHGQLAPNIQASSSGSCKIHKHDLSEFQRSETGRPLLCSRVPNRRGAVLDLSCQIYSPTRPLSHLPKAELREVWKCTFGCQKSEQQLIFSRDVAASSPLQPSGSNSSSQPVETVLLAPSSHPPPHFVSMTILKNGLKEELGITLELCGFCYVLEY